VKLWEKLIRFWGVSPNLGVCIHLLFAAVCRAESTVLCIYPSDICIIVCDLTSCVCVICQERLNFQILLLYC